MTTAATTLEQEFVAFLAEIASDQKWAYARWLETHDGEELCDDSFCSECVIIQRYIERHNKTGFTRISGWNELFDADSPPSCGRCDVLLHHTLSKHGLESEIEAMETATEVTAYDAAVWHNALTCGGEFEADRDKWWPQIEPHARRLMGIGAKTEV